MTSEEYLNILKQARKDRLTQTLIRSRKNDELLILAILSVSKSIRELPERTGIAWRKAKLKLFNSIDTTMNSLNRDFEIELQAGMLQLAQLAADRQNSLNAHDDQFLNLTLSNTFTMSDGSAVDVKFSRAAFMAYERQSLETYDDDLTLSDRLDRLDTEAREDLKGILVDGLTRDKSSTQIADSVDTILAAGVDNTLSRSQRLVRTELANVYRQSTGISAMGNESIWAILLRLSSSHSRADVCDLYCEYDQGLGAGVYPTDDVPSPHANCLCEAYPILVEFKDASFPGRQASVSNVPNSQKRLFLKRYPGASAFIGEIN